MGNLFVAAAEGLQTALTIFVTLNSCNTTTVKEDPAYSAGSLLFAAPSNYIQSSEEGTR